MNDYKIFKKIRRFIGYHNAPVIALELAIFTGAILALAAPDEPNQVIQVIQEENSQPAGWQPQAANTQDENLNQDKDSGQDKLETLKIKEVSSAKFAFKTLDNDIIEIATEKHSLPKPYLKINKWGGEVFLKVGIPFEVEETPVLNGNKLRYSSIIKGDAQIDIEFYPREPETIIEKDSRGDEHSFMQNEKGGIEFDTILYGKPETNQIVFPIEAKGLEFRRQLPLNQELQNAGITCSENECLDNQGEVVAFQPSSQISSYLVYYADKQPFYKNTGEAEKYNTLQIFQIYRPKITDAQGDEIWGDIYIDEANSQIVLTIDQNWLDKAVYPVIIDPTFGLDSGDYTWTEPANTLQGMYFQNTAGTGTLTQLELLVNDTTPAGSARLGVYADSSGAPGALLLDAGAVTVANGWIAISGLSLSVTLDTFYWLAYGLESANGISYQPGVSGTHCWKTDVSYGALPNPFPAVGGCNANQYVMRATVTTTTYQPRPPVISPSGGGFLSF